MMVNLNLVCRASPAEKIVRGFALVLVAATALGSTTHADENPHRWAKMASGEDMVASYPPDALQKGWDGKAAIKCAVTADRKLKDCIVLAEIPKNMGFGKAALTLSKRFLVDPSVPEREVAFSIRWSISSATNPPRAKPVKGPLWISIPTQSDLITAFPSAAAGKTDRGLVQLQCDIFDDGRLVGCKASSAEPSGLGFEEAALNLAKTFRADPQWRIEFNDPVHITLPIQFATADSNIWKARNLGKINWTQVVDLQTAQSSFPAAAAKAGIASGSAVVNCAVADNGALIGCAPESEDPAGMGFGPAVAEVAGRFVMVPWAATGIPAGGARIRLPMTLTRGDPAPTPATKP